MQSIPKMRYTAACLGLWASVQNAYAEYQLDMTPGVTEISKEIHGVHTIMLVICTVIGIAVFGAIFYSLIKHRKSVGHKAEQFHENTTVEIVWTVIPFIILIVMAIPATKTMIAMNDTADSELTVLITGSQWKWHYEYLSYKDDEDVGLGFYSLLSTPREQIENKEAKGENYLLEVDNPLVIPANKKVRFLITADDVIHSWWIPDFAVKKDAIPGFVNEFWTNVPTTGTYRGQCTELCGKDHGFMPVVVEVKEQQEFDQWLLAKKDEQAQAALAASQSLDKEFTMDELMAEGEKVYMARCAACHQANGEGLPGVFPAIKDAPMALNDDASAHIDIVVNGKAGTAMQAFGDQLTLLELAAVITYERNAWGNNTGDVVQPRDVKK